jgi:N-acetyl-anhydromuramyl-L-alanine amidase AmpD
MDPTNLVGDDECYLDTVSFGDAQLRVLTLALLEGTHTAEEAEEFLDLNHAWSQVFIADDLNATIHENSTAGHSSSRPMKGMVIHYTASQREDGTIRYFVSSDPHASTHFVIGSYRNGLAVQIFSHRNRTWHAGNTYNPDHFGVDFANAGYLRPRTGGGWEDYAGREYVMHLPLWGNEAVTITDGIPGAAAKYANPDHWQPYTYYQLLSFVAVGRALHAVYNLRQEHIVRHGDVASSRVDPGPALPTTALKDLILNRVSVFSVEWLTAYKTDADWIVEHPEAR